MSEPNAYTRYLVENPQCAVCGARFALHEASTLWCPKDGQEAPLSVKQEWQDTKFSALNIKIVNSAAIAPPEARQDEALVLIRIIREHLSTVGRCRDSRDLDMRDSELRIISARLDQLVAALRSRPSATATDAYSDEDLRALADLMDGNKAHDFAVLAFHLRDLDQHQAVRPSTQGEDDERLIRLLSSIAFNAKMDTREGWLAMQDKFRSALRVRLASADASAQSVAELLSARGYLASAEDVPRVAQLLAEAMPADASARELREALKKCAAVLAGDTTKNKLIEALKACRAALERTDDTARNPDGSPYHGISDGAALERSKEGV